MKIVNLLEFLNKSEKIYALDFIACNDELINFLDIIIQDEQFTPRINLGVMYVNTDITEHYILIDGLKRILSLSLLLHAVCECYKKTSSKNDKAIKTIRNKYLLKDGKTKLKLPKDLQVIYEKIIFGEKLSGKEKETKIFSLLHSLWVQIKENHLLAANIFKMLQRLEVIIVENDNINERDLYYYLNKDNRQFNSFLLIENFLNDLGLKKEWHSLLNLYNNSYSDFNMFLKDYFITKIKFKNYDKNKLYEIFVNYFNTMLQYMDKNVLITKIKNSAKAYSNILNVDIDDSDIKKALIKIKMSNAEDTYAYILNIYEDYIDGSISKATLLEILTTINEYLKKRTNTPNDVAFNDLINYLNAFITCK